MLTRRPARAAAEILRARGIQRVVYFHSDHFEPWRYVPGRPADYALSVADVERYIRETAPLDFARRATLFYKANVNFLVAPDRKLWRADPDDAIGFLPPFKEADAYSAQVLDALTRSDRELQLHIHHENVTWNDRVRDQAVRAHLEDPAHRRYDHERFELLLRLNLDLLERQAPGFDRNRWFFVHGHWALNASDPHECTIVHEIEILRRNGCLGDFTQPSGRPHTDSRSEEPYLVRPVSLTKGYDRPEAEPVAAAGAGGVPADRFLIWASRINHRHTSIDHYSGFVRERMKDPETFARFNAELSFAHDGVLYVKTHAHTMQPIYWQPEGGPFPHAHPAIQAELGRLFDAAAAAGAEVEFATVNEVFDRLMAAPKPAERDLVRHYGLDEGDPMSAVGCDIVFRDARGNERGPPSLAPEPVAIPGLSTRHAAGAVPPDLVWATIEERALPNAAEAPPPIPLTADPALVAIGHALAEVVAGVLTARGETSGSVPGAAASGPLAAEMHLVRTVEEAGLDPDAPLVEIGCGTGLLSTLLAARGWTVLGLDRRPRRLETARAIAEAAGAAGLLAQAPRFEAATFPAWRPSRWPAGQATAIVPGIANEGGLSGQAAFIRGLAAFDGALIDLRHFFVERVTGAEQQRLVELFTQAGFDPPRMVEGEGPARLAMFHHARPRGLSGWAERMLRGLGIGRAA